jgi:DNA-binding HxlR family transcriptional regulator
MVVDPSNHSRYASARRHLKVLFLPQRYHPWHIHPLFAVVAKNPPMPPQPAADRPAIPHETSPGGSSPQAWPRFEVCIDGRCPIEDTLNAIAGRWKILILWWLQEGEMRFSELRRRVPSITQKVLTQQLRQMEEEGLVCREVFAQVPPKVIYSLTERGQSLRPVLRSLYDWSRDHPPKAR